MKALFFIFLLPLGAFAQKMTAVEYNDKIVNCQNDIGYKMLAIGEYVGSEEETTKEGANLLRDSALKAAKKAVSELEKMGAYNGDDAMRKAALNLFRFYENILTNEYAQMVEILYKEDFTEADSDQLALLVQVVSEKEAPFDEKFETAQVAFAAKNGIELEENPLQEKIDEE